MSLCDLPIELVCEICEYLTWSKIRLCIGYDKWLDVVIDKKKYKRINDVCIDHLDECLYTIYTVVPSLRGKTWTIPNNTSVDSFSILPYDRKKALIGYFYGINHYVYNMRLEECYARLRKKRPITVKYKGYVGLRDTKTLCRSTHI